MELALKPARPLCMGLMNVRTLASLKSTNSIIFWESNTQQVRRKFGSNMGYREKKELLRSAHVLQNRVQREFERIASLQGVKFQSSVSGGISDQILQSTLSKEDGKNPDQSKEEEDRKQKENAARALKYSLISIGSMVVGCGVYIFFVWGAPGLDDEGNELKDEFSHLGFVEQRFRRSMNAISLFSTSIAEPSREKLLPDPVKFPYYQPPYTLLIEITGVLIHPEWTYKTGWRFKKRPGVDYFWKQLEKSQLFEIVIYTQEGGFTAMPIVKALDSSNVVAYHLYRDSTKYVDGLHMKDLDRVNRDLSKVIMVDCNSEVVKTHRDNALVLPRWNGNDDDRTLFDLASLLQTISSNDVGDVRGVLDHYAKFSDPISEFREKRRLVLEQEEQTRTLSATKKTGGGIPGLNYLTGGFFKRS